MNQDGPSLIIQLNRCLWGLEAYIYIMFMSYVDQFILI